MRPRPAFTLLELLIVVAIIAILAALAIPNLLAAQVRAKVSRARSDMRTMALALETYRTDQNAYPQCHLYGVAGSAEGWDPRSPQVTMNTCGILERLSTPVAYLTNSLIQDPFLYQYRISAPTSEQIASEADERIPLTGEGIDDTAARLNSYIYQAWDSRGRALAMSPHHAWQWVLHSVGPDNTYFNLGGVLAIEREPDGPILLIYDPSNGTVSFGSLFSTGGAQQSGGSYAGGEGLVRAIRMGGG